MPLLSLFILRLLFKGLQFTGSFYAQWVSHILYGQFETMKPSSHRWENFRILSFSWFPYGVDSYKNVRNFKLNYWFSHFIIIIVIISSSLWAKNLINSVHSHLDCPSYLWSVGLYTTEPNPTLRKPIYIIASHCLRSFHCLTLQMVYERSYL